MTFLTPALLALGLAVAVPLALHLLQRHPGPRVVFPALRYLRRAEREHARRIRLRQVLLLALRILALIFLTAAAARPFIRGGGHDHPPTSVVLVLDNSLSTGAVTGDRRVLDELADAALATLEAAGPGDRFWLIRAGSPWEPALAGDATTIAEAVRRTEPTAAAADLAGELQRARGILTLEPEAQALEIQLLSDLQASGLRPMSGDAGRREGRPTPIVVYVPSSPPPVNRAVTAVEVGGGLPPRAGQRSTVAVSVAGTEDDSVAVRLVLDGSVRAAGQARPGATVVLPYPARGPGRVAGHVELDPDALRADDRRYFVTEVVPPAPVTLVGAPAFLEEAVSVLEDAGRVRRVPLEEAAVVIAGGARSVESIRRGAAVVVLPPATPLELAATNQRLAGAGVPWRYEAPGPGEAALDTTTSALARTLGDVRLRQVYGLSGPPGDSIPLRLRTGEPWTALGRAADGGRFVVLGSPLTAEGSTLPVSAAMIPFLDHVLTAWAVDVPERPALEPGGRITVAGDMVAGPDGTAPVSAGGTYRVTAPGLYHVLSASDTVAVHAVNPSAAESRLDRVPPDEVAARVPGVEATAGPGDWLAAIFRDRLGREITPWLLAAALALLVLEAAIAATGRARRRDRTAAGAMGDDPLNEGATA